MQAIEVLDIKYFMQLLFQTDTLDSYEFVSSEVSTDLSYSIDGHIHKSFFSEDELSILEIRESQYLPWKLTKEKLFLLIKGKKIPSQMNIVLKLSPAQTMHLLSSVQSSFSTKDIDGLFLNIRFQDNKLTIVCGVSYTIFTMDKQLETDFSNSIIQMLRSKNITCN